MSEKTNVTFVIPTMDNYQYLSETLKCLNVDTRHIRKNVVIFNNHEDDLHNEHLRMMHKNFDEYKHLTVEVMNQPGMNVLYAPAMNRGIIHALKNHNPEVLVLLNDDVFFDYSHMQKMIDDVLITNFDIVGPVTNNCYGIQNLHNHVHLKSMESLLDPVDSVDSYRYSDVVKTYYGIGGIDLSSSSYINRVQAINGFCMVINALVFNTIGVLDEDRFPLSGEEWDFCYRAYDARFNIGVDESCFVWHYKHKTVNKMPHLEQFWTDSNKKLQVMYPGRFPKQVI